MNTLADTDVLKLEREIENRGVQIALLKEIVSAVSRHLDLDHILRLVAEHARTLIQAETLLIPVLDGNTDQYTYRTGAGKNVDEIVGESLPIEMGICGWVWKHKRPWWHGVLDELSEEERTKWEHEAGSVILVPLIGRFHFLGGIAGINKIGGSDFDADDLALLSMLADQVVIAIDNSALLDQLAKSNASLSEEKERAQTTLSSIVDAVLTTDTHGVVDYLNPAAAHMLGLALDEALGRRIEDLFLLSDDTTGRPVGNPVSACLREDRSAGFASNQILTRTDRSQVYVETSASAIRNQAGAIIGVVIVFHDVSQAREMAGRIAHQATHDSLTDLINRREFEFRLQRALVSARESGHEHSLLYLDLDQFKVVNDTCGHTAGDELLRQLTAQLVEIMRRDDTLARLGGDEFGALLERCPRERALEIANRLREVIEAFRFVWEDRTFRISVSIGMVTLHRNSPSLERLMGIVDAACFMAKEQGRNRIHVSDELDDEMLRRHGEMQWAPRISEAIEQNRLVLYQQTIAPIRPESNEGLHYEVLVRMRDEQGNLIPPGAFLPAAERYNLIASIDRWVVFTVMELLRQHPEHLDQLSLCSINLSGHSLGNEQFLAFIEQQLDRSGLPPEKICFEITETEAIANLSRARNFIATLRAHGCRFALDDFGSGFSSYAYLKNLPVDFLKIDGIFVKDMARDPINRAMVESINQIGHVMNRKTIAEFVEDEATLAILSEIGIDYAQGYGVAMPSPLQDLFEQ